MISSRRMKKIEVSPLNQTNLSKQVRTIDETVEYLRIQSVEAGQRVEHLQAQDGVESIVLVARQRLRRIMETLEAIEEARN